MDVITLPDQEILRALPQLIRIKGKNYRLNKFLVFVDLDNGDKLIYNTFVNSLVRIRPEEFEKIYSEELIDYLHFLYRNYFLVTENIDEFDFIELYRKQHRKIITDNYLDSGNSYTILTTTKCNARCFYCYELHTKSKHHMSNETANKVADFIINRSDRRKHVKLSWFGGEPLYNSEACDIICNRLRDEGIGFRSSIISNGYLFDELMCKKAKNSWNLQTSQITLDGTEEVYNKAKNYIYKDTNPFLVVIQNMENQLKEGIKISVRLNVDLYNSDNLLELIKFLGERFKEYGNKGKNLLSVYCHEIFELGEFSRNSELRELLFKNMAKIVDATVENNLNTYSLDNIKTAHCMVDTGGSYMISIDGGIGLCEHYIDSDFLSSVDDNLVNKDFDIINSWQNYKEPEEMCKDCPLHPQCLKMHKCPDEIDCDTYELKYKIDNIKKGMKYMYQLYLNQLNNKSRGQCNVTRCNCNQLQVLPVLALPLSLWDKIKMYFSNDNSSSEKKV